MNNSFTNEETKFKKWQKVLQNKEKICKEKRKKILQLLLQSSQTQQSGEKARIKLEEERISKIKHFSMRKDIIEQKIKAQNDEKALLSPYLISPTDKKRSTQNQSIKVALHNSMDLGSNADIENKLSYLNNRFQRCEEIVKEVNEKKSQAASVDKAGLPLRKKRVMSCYMAIMERRILKLHKKYSVRKHNVKALNRNQLLQRVGKKGLKNQKGKYKA